MSVEEARQDYTWHVVRSACCTGGRLCSTGQRLARRAWVEQARREYVEWIEAVSHEHRRAPLRSDGSCPICAWSGRTSDALSLAYDLAVAAAHPCRVDPVEALERRHDALATTAQEVAW